MSLASQHEARKHLTTVRYSANLKSIMSRLRVARLVDRLPERSITPIDTPGTTRLTGIMS